MAYIILDLKRYGIAAALALVLISTLGYTGCAATNPATVSHPGAVNSFDSQTYDTLLTVQAGIEQAKTQFGANPAAKDPLNKVIAAYDAAQATYKAYHAAVSAGSTLSVTPATLQTQVDSVKTSLASIMAQFGGK